MEQPMPVAGKVSVTDHLIESLRERQAKGIATYGRSLETFNGRSSPRDTKEELLDALQYTEQWIIERDELLKEVQRLRGAIEAALAHLELYEKVAAEDGLRQALEGSLL